ncbi:MAG TPA: hypothetical protein VKD90_17430 [Gemmataceae bacterium]|nr:hypothetical protein [Gemmataceae bacterium]
MQHPTLSLAEAELLSELLHAALPLAEARALGRPVQPPEGARVLAQLSRWANTHPVHPADLLGVAERLRRAS